MATLLFIAINAFLSGATIMQALRYRRRAFLVMSSICLAVVALLIARAEAA